MDRKTKGTIKLFIFVFVLAYIVINWNNVSWIFNYREVSGLVYDFFNPYQDSEIVANTAIIPSDSGIVDANIIANTNVSMSTNTNINYASQNNSLDIPAIGLVTPVVIGESMDKNSLAVDLDKGAVFYPGSVLPGENGQIVILGHSAPLNWPFIKHDWIFTKINDLNLGDQIILYFNNTKYVYSVTGKSIIKRGQDVGDPNSANKNILTLVSCWPPGKDYLRIAVVSELKKTP